MHIFIANDFFQDSDKRKTNTSSRIRPLFSLRLIKLVPIRHVPGLLGGVYL